MPVVRITASFVSLIVSPAIFFLSGSFAAEPVLEVRLASGRLLQGTMDAASTPDHFVLRSERNGMTVRRTVEWPRIVEVKSDGIPNDLTKLREKTDPPGDAALPKPNSPIRRIELRGDALSGEIAVSPPEPRLAPVAMIAFDARIANWDADVETDGLLINFAPLDIDGHILPVAGTLEVSLYARERRTLDQAPLSGGDTVELVEHWTLPIALSHFSHNSGARLRLPFGAAHPELELRWMVSAYGLVHVRFVAPGHGVFDDSRDALRLRPFAPSRDRLQQNMGYRFLPGESLGRPN
jgi:hypothetical protein